MNQSNIAAAATRSSNAGPSSSKLTVSHAENDERKRAREQEEDDDEDEGRDGKKRRGSNEDMEMDEGDSGPSKSWSLDLFPIRCLISLSYFYHYSFDTSIPNAVCGKSSSKCDRRPPRCTIPAVRTLFFSPALLLSIPQCLPSSNSHPTPILSFRYSGFQGTKLSAPNPTTKSKTAHVRFDSADQATVALEALNGFQIDRGWKIRVAYAAV